MSHIKSSFFFFFEFLPDQMLCYVIHLCLFSLRGSPYLLLNKVTVNLKCLPLVKVVEKTPVYHKMIAFSLLLLLVKLGKTNIFAIF